MKTIADQYKLVTEGKLGQFQFMRNVRLTFPQFVTNVTSFGDAVKILKNKGVISEAYVNPESVDHEHDPQQYDLGMRYELSKGTDELKADKIVTKNLKSNRAYYTNLHLAGYNEDAMRKDGIIKENGTIDVTIISVDKYNQAVRVSYPYINDNGERYTTEWSIETRDIIKTVGLARPNLDELI